MLNLNAMFNTSSDVFDTGGKDSEVNNKSLDADYLLNDLSSSINAISSQFSALMSSNNRISDMYSYIKLYGVDRACVQVYNRDGLLTDLSNGVVPATEAFCESNVSKYTIACMEGLGESITKVFKWCIEKLKAIGKWIADKVIGAFKWLMSKFSSNKKQIAEGMKQSEKLASMATKVDGDESQITSEMKQEVSKVDETYKQVSTKLLWDIRNRDSRVETHYSLAKSYCSDIEEAIQKVTDNISLIGSNSTGDPTITDRDKRRIKLYLQHDSQYDMAGGLTTLSKKYEKKELEMLEYITQVYTTIYSGKNEATPEYGGILKHYIKSHIKFTKEVYTALAAHESKIEKIIQELTGRADEIKKKIEQLHKDLAKALEKVDVNHESKIHSVIGAYIAEIAENLQVLVSFINDLARDRFVSMISYEMIHIGDLLFKELKYFEL